jgi:acyl-coenzyme A thioesterase PaaI-like protein
VASFYVDEGRGRFASTPATAGPWDPSAQHGGPPAALLTRAVEALDPGRVVGRLTMELLGPVPVGPLEVRASVVRPGRSVQLVEATAYDVQRDRACARATAWLFPAGGQAPATAGAAPERGPDQGVTREPPPSWSRGYLDAIEWRWVEGTIEEPGPAVVWMRPRTALVDGEPMSPVQRLMTCVDSASGVSSAVDFEQWMFLNTELTVHVLRPPVGDWVCLDATTVLGGGSIGVATATVSDEGGVVARSAQALLVVRR